MSETTSQAAAARWWQTAWAWLRQRAAALILVLTSRVTAFARWRIEHPTVLGAALDALLIIVVAGCFAALVLVLPWPKPARLAQPDAPTSDQLHSLESRVSALESTVAGLVVATPAPASPSARRPATASPAAAVTTNATPAPPTGHTDLDRRLAEFQRRIDATPSSTTTLKETAK